MSFETLLAQLTESEDDIFQTPDFFISAVKAAILSGREIRMKITQDMADVLNCDIESLMFLFEDKTSYKDNKAQTVLPCFRQTMML